MKLKYVLMAVALTAMTSGCCLSGMCGVEASIADEDLMRIEQAAARAEDAAALAEEAALKATTAAEKAEAVFHKGLQK